jgi:hypothetical protein
MNSPRFNYDRRLGTTSRPSPGRYPKSIRISRVGSLPRRLSTGAGRKKIFAIVAPPMSADFGGKTIRCVLIFDNHPDSLRLASEIIYSDIDVASPRRINSSHVTSGLVLIFALVLGIFWPLIVS